MAVRTRFRRISSPRPYWDCEGGDGERACGPNTLCCHRPRKWAIQYSAALRSATVVDTGWPAFAGHDTLFELIRMTGCLGSQWTSLSLTNNAFSRKAARAFLRIVSP